MELYGQTHTELILFFTLYGITGVVHFIGALYLLLRRANAIAPDITPPVRLRRWAAAFFAVSALSHVWWFLFYVYSNDFHSVSYLVIVTLDYVGIVTTIAGTMLSMLQDRKRPVWPVFVAMVPFLALEVLKLSNPDGSFMEIAIVYSIVLYVLFFIYLVFAIRRYGRWLNDNYSDLEDKKVWLSQAVSLAYVLMFILYVLATDINLIVFLLHIVELVFFVLLLWRVETLPQLESISTEDACISNSQSLPPDSDPLTPNPKTTLISTIDIAQIEQMLAERCVDTQLYLQHDLTVQNLAHAIGTNRYYLSQYFSRQGITYNAYINNLRINHFISRYQESVAVGQTVIAQQLASESGYRSYSTFSLAFKQRMGQNVTAWLRERGG